jgi:prepilin-type processing-associated H-X9-DG protein
MEMTDTVFRCPTGIFELQGITSITTQMPVSRTDGDGESGVHYTSKNLSPGLIIDVWYGVNGTTDNDSTVPLRRIPPDGSPMTSAVWPTLFEIRHPSDLVLLYDGLWANQMSVNANRVNARHLRRTMTNMLFFDGHAESITTSSLPGGAGDANKPAGPAVTFGAANLANFPFPKWRINQ